MFLLHEHLLLPKINFLQAYLCLLKITWGLLYYEAMSSWLCSSPGKDEVDKLFLFPTPSTPSLLPVSPSLPLSVPLHLPPSPSLSSLVPLLPSPSTSLLPLLPLYLSFLLPVSPSLSFLPYPFPFSYLSLPPSTSLPSLLPMPSGVVIFLELKFLNYFITGRHLQSLRHLKTM